MLVVITPSRCDVIELHVGICLNMSCGSFSQNQMLQGFHLVDCTYMCCPAREV